VKAAFSCIQSVAEVAEIIVFNVHHHHGGVLGREGAVDQDLESCDVGNELHLC
jgi:hypothetical protein